MATVTTEHERFLQSVIDHQSRLYGFVLALLANRDLADEILQEVNLTLLRKEADYQPETTFFAWACQIAFYQVLTFRKRRQRDALVFDEELLEMLAVEAERASHVEPDEQKRALRHCLKTLPAQHRELIARRYRGTSVIALSAESGRSTAAVSQTLYRLRAILKRCIERTLTRDAEAYECS